MPRYSCPRCAGLLDDARVDGLRMYRCHACEGRAVNITQVRDRMPSERFSAMWQAARAAEACGPGCPVCRKPMRVIMAGRRETVEVDICTGCQMLWLDAGEQEKLGVSVSRAAAKRTVEQAAADQAAAVLLAEAKIESDAQQAQTKRRIRRGAYWLDALTDLLMWGSLW